MMMMFSLVKNQDQTSEEIKINLEGNQDMVANQEVDTVVNQEVDIMISPEEAIEVKEVNKMMDLLEVGGKKRKRNPKYNLKSLSSSNKIRNSNSLRINQN